MVQLCREYLEKAERGLITHRGKPEKDSGLSMDMHGHENALLVGVFAAYSYGRSTAAALKTSVQKFYLRLNFRSST